MCLILLALDSHPDYGLIVAANRDEFYSRPTAPAAFWPDAPTVLGGRDLEAGGTWLGITRNGRFAAVTNYRQGQREPAAPRSRGLLVSEFLIGTMSVGEHVERVAHDATQYNGFNLIVGSGHELGYFSNREGRARTLAPGVYGLSNHLLDTPWPKVTAAKSGLAALLHGAEVSDLIAGLFALLADRKQPADHLLPRTGIGEEWERLLSAAFIASRDYGTRSSTVLLVGRDGRVGFIEHSFESDGAAAEPVRHEFTLG